ncbi:Dihydropteroate synthase [Arcticibacter svalbardensis MN12-7]|uniref:dihydropteroate synthase n=1 Tax=Arcticibacter svalbardensis MN12-7 TaxID=1150600 RepID=R9GUT7_9SPHI|nr:dihydropteroate synthase [Arcticibacter svalbardensis]EOR95458.1 Dihydropteroate synthase [Arcticibacter svalbardensis MN12-7]
MNDKSTFFHQKNTINAGGSLIDFTIPKVMGILNITPDSFFGDSRVQTVERALIRTEKLLSEGAELLDLGAYSSRPGAIEVSEEEETTRLIPVIEAIVSEFPNAILSIDTFRSSVAKASIEAGAHIINDISGGELDPLMFETVAKLQVPYILMHMRGTPQTMNKLTNYEDLFAEILAYFSAKIEKLSELHVHDVILDPGFGFAKTIEQNFELLNELDRFKLTGLPILVGLSRKRTIWKTLDISTEEALNGTTVLNTIALMKGAKILRVHDVKEAVEAVKLTECLKH